MERCLLLKVAYSSISLVAAGSFAIGEIPDPELTAAVGNNREWSALASCWLFANHIGDLVAVHSGSIDRDQACARGKKLFLAAVERAKAVALHQGADTVVAQE